MVPSNAFVCLMGMGVVFISLFVMVLLCNVIHYVCDKLDTHFTKNKQ